MCYPVSEVPGAIMPAITLRPPATRSAPIAFAGGAIIGALGGLIGLGGAEFRLPLLIGVFRFAALQAVILNKAMSLVVVASALPFRASTVPFSAIAAHWSIVVNLLAGSLLGAWFGAGWAIRLASHTLYRVIAILLVRHRHRPAARSRYRCIRSVAHGGRSNGDGRGRRICHRRCRRSAWGGGR